MGGTIICKTVKEKYLGVTINANMKCSEQCTIAASQGKHILEMIRSNITYKKKGKGMVLYSAVSSPLDRSERFTLSSPGRPIHSDTVLGFSWKHSSHAAIAQRLFTHISTTVYSTHLYS